MLKDDTVFGVFVMLRIHGFNTHNHLAAEETKKIRPPKGGKQVENLQKTKLQTKGCAYLLPLYIYKYYI